MTYQELLWKQWFDAKYTLWDLYNTQDAMRLAGEMLAAGCFNKRVGPELNRDSGPKEKDNHNAH